MQRYRSNKSDEFLSDQAEEQQARATKQKRLRLINKHRQPAPSQPSKEEQRELIRRKLIKALSSEYYRGNALSKLYVGLLVRTMVDQ